MAAAAERAGKGAEAEAALRRGLAAGGDGDLFDHLYWRLCRGRRWREAVALCEEADGRVGPGGKRKGPPLLGWYLALPLAELGREAEAVRAIDAAVPNAVSPLAVRLRKAEVLSALGRHEQALAVCDEVAADAASPADLRRVRLRRSQAHLGRRDFAASERELRAVLEDDPEDAEALNNLGYHLADEGRDLAEAEALVRRAVELDRADRLKRGDAEAESGTYLDSLAWVRFKRGDLAGARTLFERAVALSDAAADPTVWDHLGDVRFRLGDAAGARAAWRAADDRYTDTHLGRQFGRQAEVRRKLRRVP